MPPEARVSAETRRPQGALRCTFSKVYVRLKSNQTPRVSLCVTEPQVLQVQTMAQLKHRESGRCIHVQGDHLLGRSQRCTTRLDDGHVSSEHACLRWDGACWLLKDLGSTNGTSVDGRSLRSGESVTLHRGAHLSFGHPTHVWELIDDSAPCAMAVSLDETDTIVSEHGLLALPSPELPLVTVHRDSDGSWLAEGIGTHERVKDQSLLLAGERAFKLYLPALPERTTRLNGLEGRRVADVSITFHASSDLEHIELELSCEGVAQRLGARSHNEMLLVLGRARVSDHRQGLDPASCGWMYQDDLCRAVALEPERLNVDVYRIRRQAAGLGLLDPANIVERRTKTRQMRLGTGLIHELTMNEGSARALQRAVDLPT